MIIVNPDKETDSRSVFNIIETDENVVIKTNPSLNQITTKFICLLIALVSTFTIYKNLSRLDEEVGLKLVGSFVFIILVAVYFFFKAEGVSTIVKMDHNGIELAVDKGAFQGSTRADWKEVKSIRIQSTAELNSTFLSIRNNESSLGEVRLFLGGLYKISGLNDPSSSISLFIASLEKYATQFSGQTYEKSPTLSGIDIKSTN
ncbi:MAG: hypothetical protein HRT44_11860 [Bdellovibrionales bacterium]|nr:hypothetical protein [Bdellovibrionales bacterium]NQZ19935.1 hypothetical protein [Bdellovibrionales bacterium]